MQRSFYTLTEAAIECRRWRKGSSLVRWHSQRGGGVAMNAWAPSVAPGLVHRPSNAANVDTRPSTRTPGQEARLPWTLGSCAHDCVWVSSLHPGAKVSATRHRSREAQVKHTAHGSQLLVLHFSVNSGGGTARLWSLVLVNTL